MPATWVVVPLALWTDMEPELDRRFPVHLTVRVRLNIHRTWLHDDLSTTWWQWGDDAARKRGCERNAEKNLHGFLLTLDRVS